MTENQTQFRSNYRKALVTQTNNLPSLFKDYNFVNGTPKCGVEIEGWIIDQHGCAQSKIYELMSICKKGSIQEELSQYNFEFDTPPLLITKNYLTKLHTQIQTQLDELVKAAAQIESKLILIGTLPSLTVNMLSTDVMSKLNRYQLLNNAILNQHENQQIDININGKDSFSHTMESIMLESATTSLQINFQTHPQHAHHLYNVCLLASLPAVAICANSPFFDQRCLWDSARIALFEQAVCSTNTTAKRVGLGAGFLQNAITELYQHNLQFNDYINKDFETNFLSESFDHLRYHNTTVWRWVRPRMSIDSAHSAVMRIESRVFGSGPSIVDMVANIAFFTGLVYYLLALPKHSSELIPFDRFEASFYEACKHGLHANVDWIGFKNIDIAELIEHQLIDNAFKGLLQLGVNSEESDYYLNTILRTRIRSRLNGSEWQKQFINHHGPDFSKLTMAYYYQQQTKLPLSEWVL